MTRVEVVATVVVGLMAAIGIPNRAIEIYRDGLTGQKKEKAMAQQREQQKDRGLEVTEHVGEEIQKGNEDIAFSMLTPEQMAEGDQTAERR